MRLLIAASAVLLIAGGCAKTEGSETSASAADSTVLQPARPANVSVDFSSPESAIESYWQLIDLERSGAIDAYTAQIASEDFRLVSGFHERLRSELSPAQAMLVLVDTTTYQREVASIQREADNRAVVLAEISRTAPPTMDLAATDTSAIGQRISRKVRYVLERSPTGWRAVLIDLIYE